MFKYKNHRFTKLSLILMSEFVAMVATTLFSKYVFLIHHSLLVYTIGGVILAALVAMLYDRTVSKKRTQAEAELKELTNVAMRIYHTDHK